MDGIRFKVKEDYKYIEKSIYIIISINIEGFKEILDFWVSESEFDKEWLSETIKSTFSNTIIQKCVIHQIRNSLKFVKYDDKK